MDSEVGQWLQEQCKREKLSLRQAAAKTGINHTTIGLMLKGEHHTSPETIRKLAAAFSADGERSLRALEDKLLTLAGYRTAPASEDELSPPLARLMDLVSGFSEPQLKQMARFAEFLSQIADSGDVDKGGKR